MDLVTWHGLINASIEGSVSTPSPTGGTTETEGDGG